jgi:polyphosphate kinase
VHYYELHEGDDELYSDVLLAREEEIAPEDFFDLVQAVREQVMAEFEEDTLIEAIAVELERSHGFTYISDERLAAAVNVSADDDENYLIATSEDELEELRSDADYRGVFVDYTGDGDDLPVH